MVRRLVGLGVLSLTVSGGGCDEDPLGSDASPRNIGTGGLVPAWRVEWDEVNTAVSDPALDQARLYADVNRIVTAFSLEDGSLLWEYERPSGGPGNIVVQDGRLMFAGDWAIALDAATGQEIWRFRSETYAGLSESAADQRAFYFGTEHHVVYAVDVDDGSLLWRTDVGEDWPFQGVVRGTTVSGDTLYVTLEHFYDRNGSRGTADVVALDRRTGEILWRWEEGDGSDLRLFQSAATVADDLLLVGDVAQNTYIGLDRFSLEERWRFSGAPGWFGYGQSPTVSGDRGYVGAQSGEVWAFEVETGEAHWKTVTLGGTHNLAPCGRVLVGDQLQLLVLDLQSGTILYQDYHRDEVLQGIPLQVVDERVYLFTDRARYAFDCPT